MDWEFAVLDYIQQHWRCGFLDTFMPIVTKLADGGWFWILLVICGFFSKRTRKYAFVGAVGLMLCAICGNLILKPAVARVRPFNINTDVQLLIKAPTDYSFPSGHTQSSFAVATAVFMKKRSWGTAALALASVIGFSRLYLYVHYPTDVIAGVIFGVGFALIGLLLSNLFFKDKEGGEGAKARG